MKITSTLMRVLTFMLFAITTITVNAESSDLWALYCPNDVTAHCTDELWDLTIYGNAQYHDYSGYHDAGTPTESHHLSTCNTGYIYRTWTIEDPNWNWVSCTQTITVTSGSYGSFSESNIHWPSTYTVEGCSPDTDPYLTGQPTWDNVSCSMIGVSYKDKVYTVNGGCSKIIRQWTIMDWCQTNGPYGSFKTWSYNQTIKIVNNDPPTFTCIDDVTVSSKNCKNAFVSVDDFVIDDSACDAAVQITNNSPHATYGGANISGTYPIGKTKVTIYIKYGCGKTKACDINVYVVNDGGPVPICLSELTIALMGMDTDDDGINDEGMAEIWAKDLDWKSYDPCHNSDHLRFSFSEDVDSMFRIFTCDEVGENTVKMYVTDYSGNQNYCEVTIDVQNNGANIKDCERPDTTTQRLVIAGRVLAHDQGVQDLEIELVPMEDEVSYYMRIDTAIVVSLDSFVNGSGYLIYTEQYDSTFTQVLDSLVTTPESYTAMTEASGLFKISATESSTAEYMIKCVNDINTPLIDLDPADMNALIAHLLSDRPFTEARQYLAADIDGDQAITFNDAQELFDIIKFGYTEAQQKWKVTYSLASLSGSTAAFDQAHDWVTIPGIKPDMEVLQDFTAIQIGDIFDGDANNLVPDYEVNSRSQIASFTDQLKVSPNPFNDQLTFHFDAATAGSTEITIQDATGKQVFRQEVKADQGYNALTIDLSSAPKGILIYSVQKGNFVKTGKVVRL